MLAATPLLWAPTWVCMEGPHRMQISLVDISRAYFHAKTNQDDPIYVDLPPEDPEYGRGLCGRLNVHMYGTQKAADGWHSEYSGIMEELGFEVGTSSACVLRHYGLHLICSVHGDDFTTAGPPNSIRSSKQSTNSTRKFGWARNPRMTGKGSFLTGSSCGPMA